MKRIERRLAVENKRLWLVPLLVGIAALALWEAGILFRGESKLLFPPPSAVMARLVELVAQGKLQPHLAVSLRRLFLGFALGALPGFTADFDDRDLRALAYVCLGGGFRNAGARAGQECHLARQLAHSVYQPRGSARSAG